ncbi:hypothetical protein LZ31DRAFT_584977 [Colletotrichum somersetense]|nr:hypothetical protein LZ31DRAFT_584977 [Colletotrichum somersetense]
MGKGETAVCRRTHHVESQQVLRAPRRAVPRGISTFFAAHPDLVDAHSLRVFQYTITEVLPTVGVRTATKEPLHSALCRTAMSDPLAFHAVVAGGASHLRFLTNSIEDSRLQLKAQSQIARIVRQQLSTGINTISDTVLFCIMIMSVDQSPYLLSLTPEDRYVGDFDTPVKSFGGLLWQGLINFVPTHTSMWVHLLNARDPSSSNTVPGHLEADKAAAIRPHASEADVFPVDPHFKDIILDMKECCRLIDTLSGLEHPLSPEASEFVQYRNLILYRLLSLPPGVSDICRLTALVFNYGVLYPFPDPRILWNLTGQLGAVLSDPQHTTNEDAGLLLWAAVIGGIAAAGTGAYDSFAESVNKFAGLLRVEDWSQIATHLESFIWLERACGVGGRNLWARARALALSNKGSGYLHLASRPKAIIEEYVD